MAVRPCLVPAPAAAAAGLQPAPFHHVMHTAQLPFTCQFAMPGQARPGHVMSCTTDPYLLHGQRVDVKNTCMNVVSYQNFLSERELHAEPDQASSQVKSSQVKVNASQAQPRQAPLHSLNFPISDFSRFFLACLALPYLALPMPCLPAHQSINQSLTTPLQRNLSFRFV